MTPAAANIAPLAEQSGPGATRPPLELNDVSVMIGGQGGDGTLTVSDLLGRYFRKRGLYVYTSRNVLSRIRGGHADASVRGSRDPLAAVKSHVDVLVAFDNEAVEMGKAELAPHGFIIYDSTTFHIADPHSAGFPFATMVGGPLGQPIFKNTAAYGALSVLFGFDPVETRAVIEERFKRRGGEALDKNLKALEIGRKAALAAPGVENRFSLQSGDALDMILTTGNQAVALGFVVGGGRFFAGYPITPATEVMEYLQRYLPPFGGVVRQAEDELAAINMIIGASYAGARVMTSTSGPGLSLMTEGIGHASTAEIPIVVADCQRVGPSTGQPTRHEQSDLSHLANLGHGEYPRFILAPADPVDCFDLTVDALNLAERWRLPVILLLDQALCQNTTTSARFDLSRVHVDRGRRLSPEAVAKLTQYKVYEHSEDGRSAYAPPGTPGIWSEVTGNEHDEWGHVSVNPTNRGRMMKKRMEKMVNARSELPACRLFGPANAKVGIIGFGSTSGPILEAQSLLHHRGKPTRYLQARTVYPVPVHEIDPFLKEVDVAYVVEHNYTGQFARLLRETMPWHHAKLRSVLKYDGFTFRAPQIVAAMKEVA
ncbi:MAG TPA: 2-oxoacid:acceptor oxidoreductase subunit alpha [Thermoplasmata archaeon]|nr:2-oxoacid:acceptor oxidoreductase subunit alpha [Thermoplasmata archaeon]